MTTTIPVEAITGRRKEALVMAARGLSNTEIAGRLFVSVDTVKLDLRHVYLLLGARDRAQAVALAIFHGVITRQDVLGGVG